MRRATVAAALLLLTTGAAFGERLSLPLTGARLVDTRAGEARVLLSVSLPDLGNYAISQAFLLGSVTTVLQEPLDVWVRAARAAAPLAQVMSRTTLRPRDEAVICDVTGLIHGARGESGIDGIILSLPDWRGEEFPTAIAEGLRTALVNGTLEIEGRRLLRPPPRPR